MIYNINLSIGWASSGVEYAQRYRSRCFKKIKEPCKFIFLEFVNTGDIYSLTKNIGLDPNDVIWLYYYMSDIEINPCSISAEKFIKSLRVKIKSIQKLDSRLAVSLENGFLNIFIDKNKNVYKVDYVSRGILTKTEYYSDFHYCTEYYAPKDNKANLYLRTIYNKDHQIIIKEFVNSDKSTFFYQEEIFYEKESFYKCFIQKLNIKKEDFIIFDRTTYVGQAIFELELPCKIGEIVHADHYNENATDDEQILWNNFYEYTFNNEKKIDFFVASTKDQQKLMEKHFLKYRNVKPKIYEIPVGTLDKCIKPTDKRKAFSLVTASRLAPEKHVDWLICAVSEAKKQIPLLTLDIYGEGSERKKIEEAIKEYNAESFIKLNGHKNLDNILCNYETYNSSYTNEGFCLSLMEAVGSGLAMIGFKVQYGNTTFINNKANGILIDANLNEILKTKGEKLTDAIVKLYKNYNIKKMSKKSYDIADYYLIDKVSSKWEKLIKENS